MSKKAADKKFQIQNSLAPVHAPLFCNRLKWIQTATETSENNTFFQIRNNLAPVLPCFGNGDKKKRTPK